MEWIDPPRPGVKTVDGRYTCKSCSSVLEATDDGWQCTGCDKTWKGNTEKYNV